MFGFSITNAFAKEFLLSALNFTIVMGTMLFLKKVVPKKWDSFFFLAVLNPALVMADLAFGNTVSLVVGVVLCAAYVLTGAPTLFVLFFVPAVVTGLSWQRSLSPLFPGLFQTSSISMQCNLWSFLEGVVGKVDVSENMTRLSVLMIPMAFGNTRSMEAVRGFSLAV